MKAGRTTAPLTLEKAADAPVAGIDEVGRAPFAGPVVAAAVVLPPWQRRPTALAGLTDSKLLSAAERSRYAEAIRSLAEIGLGAASRREIDRHNIHNATLLAMRRAFDKLSGRVATALVDGHHAPDLPCPAQTVVGGDRKSLSIAAASVVAKVARDGLMQRLARRYPGYGFAENVGYGTEAHYIGLLRLGATPHHRRSNSAVQHLTSDLLLTSIKFEKTETAVPPLASHPLRRDLAIVTDAQARHVGFLKARKDGWTFRAVGYSETGAPIAGQGPCAAMHEVQTDSADANGLEFRIGPAFLESPTAP